MQMYDSLSADYDRFVNWENRLSLEMPFIEAQLQAVAPASRPARVLDAACGTGMHAIELARQGYQAAGADFSAGMIEHARENARQAGVALDFLQSGFGEMAQKFSGFDALLCLGNSLPHISGKDRLVPVLKDFAACLRSGGLLLLQNRNFDAVLDRRERWMGPESAHSEDQDWLFVRFYDFDPDGMITFHIITLTREGGAAWQQKHDSIRLYPLLQAELIQALSDAGFAQIKLYGNLAGDAFDRQSSGNLVVAAITQ